MIGGRGGGELKKRLGDPAQPPRNLHLESTCRTGDPSLIYGPISFVMCRLGTEKEATSRRDFSMLENIRESGLEAGSQW